MHHQAYNGPDEFEPRITPKPATKFDGFVAPSVPEVSLIFDKSGEIKKLGTKSPMPAALEKSKSYAEWREQNFSQRASHPYTDSSKSHTPQHKDISPLVKHNSATNIAVHSNQNYIPRRVNHTKESQEYNKPDVNYEHTNIRAHVMHQNADKSGAQKYLVGPHSNQISERRSDSVQTPLHSQKPQQHFHRENSYEEKHDMYSHDNRNMVVHNSEKERALYGINSTPNQLPVQDSHLNANVFMKNGFSPMLHSTGYPYPYADMNQQHFPPFYPPMYSNHSDSNETVRNLLQLVNSQSEQIKSLQTQVDRLLKMQEESLKDRAKCTCASHMCQQNTPLLIDSRDTINSSKTAISQNQNVKNNVYRDPLAIQNEPTCLNEMKNDNDIQMIQSELQARKTLLEQKVSIGVMTSFEFTVQNSPFLVESEDYEKRSLEQNELINKKNGFIYPDTAESLRRNKGSFPRIASVPLENIVEDSESHMSSSHQQSSNFNASSSTKDLHERQNNSQNQKELDACSANYNQQSPRVYEHVMQNPTQEKIGLSRYPESIQQTGVQSTKRPTMQVQDFVENYDSTKQYTDNTLAGVNDAVQANNGIQAKDIDKAQYNRNHLNKKYISKVQSNNGGEESLVLSGGDLKVMERPPTPEPSIHVDMNEYSSDDESEKVKHTSKVGWTFYNNVLGQVNQILQNSQIEEDNEHKNSRGANNVERNGIENKVLIDTVKNATLEQLRKFGISLSDNTDSKDKDTKKVAFDSSIYPRLDYQANMTQGTSSITETNTSMHMKALALKYLSDEQLADLAMQKQGSASMKHLLLSNMQGTNMSFATMRYLERYQLLPGNNNVQIEDNDKVDSVVPPKPEIRPMQPKQNPALQRYPFTQTPRTSCPSKILDISTLKQQPKLL